MGLKGEFFWNRSKRRGGKKIISFDLKNENIFQSETFDAVIIGQNVEPMFFNQLQLNAGKCYRFDYDSVDWDWCLGDTFAILDKNRDTKQKWNLNIPMYGPGECPDCHGTHRCMYCRGSGTITDSRTHMINMCMNCFGTGECQKCYVPIRLKKTSGDLSSDTSSPISTGQRPNPKEQREMRMKILRQEIDSLQSKIDKAMFDEKMMKIRGTDVSSFNVYHSQLLLRQGYEMQLSNLQSELNQLELMR